MKIENIPTPNNVAVIQEEEHDDLLEKINEGVPKDNQAIKIQSVYFRSKTMHGVILESRFDVFIKNGKKV